MAKEEEKIEGAQEAPVSKTPNRDKFNARMKKRNPDKEFADDEELFGQIDADYESAEENASTIDALNGMLLDDPRSGQFLANWKEKGDPLMALIEEYGEDIVKGMQDPEKKEEIAKANQKYLDKIASDKELDDLISKNFDASQKVVDDKKAEVGEDVVNQALEYIKGLYVDMLTGVIKPETIDMAVKAITHDTDVEQASAEGEVRGRNANISSKVKKAKAGDGIPNIGGGSPTKPIENKPSMGALDRYGSNGGTSIWDRG